MPGKWLQRYWFTPVAAESLALVRIVCFALCFVIYFDVDIRPWADVSAVFWEPLSLFRLLSGPPRKAAFLGLIQVLWKASLFTAAIGLATRASLLIAALLGFFVLGLPNCYGTIHHLDGFNVLLFAILAVSRCNDALTVDRLFWKLRPAPPKPSGAYGWPVQLAQTLFLLVFFSAGLSKLRHSGLAWFDPESMRALFLGNYFYHSPPTRWADMLMRSNALSSLSAVTAVVVELSALPAIFFRGLRLPVVIALFLLQLAICLLMGLYFVPYVAGYALFVVPQVRCKLPQHD